MTTEIESNPNDFFVAGGTLRASAPSYVLRPADEELFEMAVQGAFCYVLTPRQMGKSSLMIRTAKRLGEQGIRAGIVDLTQIGAKVTVEQWYLGLLSQLRRSLKLETDYAEWWSAHSALGEVQRFTDFLREVVLTEIKERVVIFIDEIDSTLQLDFRDDFFAAIRAMYNARAETADFGRLSFVLLGVASPPDLIRDLTRTPFNIGQAIALKEFSRADAAVLQGELEKQFPGKGGAIFERIFYWTNGHPYLTQKLCLTIAEQPQATWGDAEVDALVGQMFLTEEARKESNLQYVQNNILSHELKLPMLKLYRHVVRGVAVPENQSREQNQLKLSGLVKAQSGVLQVRNRVYGQEFDGDWVRANIPVNWTRRLAVAASALLAIFIGLVAYFFVESNYVMPNRLRFATADFFQKAASKDRIAAVATIVSSKGTFDTKDNNDSAIELFYALSWEDQLRLFDAYETRDVSDKDLVTVIKALYVTMADVDGTGGNLKLLEQVVRSLEGRERSDEAKKLKDEIRAWVDGARAEAKGDSALAEKFYGAAYNLNASNPATRFTRGKFFAKVNRPSDALNEFNEVILIAQRLATTAKSVEPTATISQPMTATGNATANSTQLPQFPQLTEVPSTSTTPSTLLIVAAPTALSTATIAPTPTPASIRFVPQFTTSGQMIVAVRDFISDDMRLMNALASSPISMTLDLQRVFPGTEIGRKILFVNKVSTVETINPSPFNVDTALRVRFLILDSKNNVLSPNIQDARLIVDGKPISTSTFSRNTWSVVLLRDASSNAGTDATVLSDSLGRALDGVNTDVNYMLLSFSDRVTQDPKSKFTADKNEIRSQLSLNASPIGNGYACLNAGLSAAIEKVSQAPGEHAVFVVTASTDTCGTPTISDVILQANANNVQLFIAVLEGHGATNQDMTRYAQASGGLVMSRGAADFESGLSNLISVVDNQTEASFILDSNLSYGKHIGNMLLTTKSLQQLSGTVEFSLNKTIQASPEILLSTPTFSSNTMSFTVDLVNQSRVRIIVVTIVDPSLVRNIFVKTIRVDSNLSKLLVPISIATLGLESGRKYLISVRAIDAEGVGTLAREMQFLFPVIN